MKRRTPLVFAIAAALSVATAAAASSPAEVADAFAAALAEGDEAKVETLMAADVLVAEEGGAELSFAQYKAEHLPADIAFSRTVRRTVTSRRVFDGEKMATVVTTADLEGEFRGRPVARRSLETMTLVRAGDVWRIAHIHWSSAPLHPATAQ